MSYIFMESDVVLLKYIPLMLFNLGRATFKRASLQNIPFVSSLDSYF